MKAPAEAESQKACPHCEGVGYFVHDGFEARVDARGLVRTEYREVCPACSGTGEQVAEVRP